MKSILPALGGLIFFVPKMLFKLVKLFLKLPVPIRFFIIFFIFIGLVGFFITINRASPESTDSAVRFVTLASIEELSNANTSNTFIGTVRSVSQAEVRAEASGVVRRVHTSLGAEVPAGFILAELENTSEQASVLQAEGVYESALASRKSISPLEVAQSVRNTYRNVYATVDTALYRDVDTFFGGPTPSGPDLLINPQTKDRYDISRERSHIKTLMNTWRDTLASADTLGASTLLDTAEETTRAVSLFVDILSREAQPEASNATALQRASILQARAEINGALTTLTGARSQYLSASTQATSGIDAGLKQAEGTLLFARANLEKTRLRSPLAGTVNTFPLRVGDFVNMNESVATIARNEALEIVSFVSEDLRALLAVGAEVTIGENTKGVITSIAPALDATTKQIEVHSAVDKENETNLVNGASVKIQIQSSASSTVRTGTLLLPLASIKLRAEDRVVFGVDEDGRLVAYKVETGNVSGDRIEILTALPPYLTIVTDARGLIEGEKVQTAP